MRVMGNFDSEWGGVAGCSPVLLSHSFIELRSTD
jgi:hypothetical protein